jgi:entericidin B
VRTCKAAPTTSHPDPERAGVFTPARQSRENLVLFVNLKGNIMKKIISLLCLITFAFGLTACNTMSGAGKDIERGGEKVQGAAERSK